jgi:PilZ domain
MSRSTVKSERRRKSRSRPPRLVYAELPNGNGGMIRDLSEEGFAVRAMMPLHAGASTYFAFSLSESIRIEGEGEILWIGENGRVAGIRFTQIASTAREQIRKWLSEPQESPEFEEIPGKPVDPPASTLEQLREEIRSSPMVGEPPMAVPDVPPLPLPEMVPVASEISPTNPPLEIAAPIENVVPPESAALPGMTLPGLQANLLGGKKLVRAYKVFSDSTETPVLPSVRPPETVTPASKVIPSAPPPKNAPSDLQASALRESDIATSPETPSLTPAPALPPRTTPIEIAAAVPTSPAALTSAHDEVVSAEAQNAFPPLGVPKNRVKPSQPDRPLPDISQILIQPAGRRTGHSANSTMLEPLSSPEWLREPRHASPTERITLSLAFKFMIVLAMGAAVSVFHREVGQSLIWLGEQMGGTQISETQLPAPNDGVSTDAPIGTPSNPSNSPTQERSFAESETPDGRTAADSGAPGNNSQAAHSGDARNATPPVTPLSGMTAPSSSNAGEDSGQLEYAQAMQILRGRSSGEDQSEVVRLLWIAVEKGNSNAELALAEMYWHGQGVGRNCDQTRILLGAAARKGSAEARKRLQKFQREGCE